MTFNAETDHGKVVWAKMSKNGRSYPAIIISTTILDLMFEEEPGKIWVWWIGDNTFSNLKTHLIFDFSQDFETHVAKPTKQILGNIINAIKIIALQYEFEIPEEFIGRDELLWATNNLRALTINRTGKRKRDEPYHIPGDIIDDIKKINQKNQQNFIKNNLTYEVSKKNVQNKNQHSKRKIRSCFSCHKLLINENSICKHPIFNGVICDDCHERKTDVLMPISNDKSNSGCCICVSDNSSSTLILCDHCIRSYCNECIDIYCGKSGLKKIIETKKWKCFSCGESSCTANLLVARTMEEQLHLIYSLYPAESSSSNRNKSVKFSKNKEINIYAVDDAKINVSNVLKQLKYPFKLKDISDLENLSISYNHTVSEIKISNKNSSINLLIQYPDANDAESVQSNKDKDENMRTFYRFIRKRDRFLFNYPNDTLFWAYETSAAIPNEQRKIMSRFCGKEPILTSMYSKDVRQRGRFIWSNITIRENNVAQFRKYNIILQNINQDFEDDQDEQAWCFSSVYIILSSLIQNNIS